MKGRVFHNDLGVYFDKKGHLLKHLKLGNVHHIAILTITYNAV